MLRPTAALILMTACLIGCGGEDRAQTIRALRASRGALLAERDTLKAKARLAQVELENMALSIELGEPQDERRINALRADIDDARTRIPALEARAAAIEAQIITLGGSP